MSKILDFEKNMEHTVSEVICIKCKTRWISVRPTEVLLKDIECRDCGSGYVIETGQIIPNIEEYDTREYAKTHPKWEKKIQRLAERSKKNEY